MMNNIKMNELNELEMDQVTGGGKIFDAFADVVSGAWDVVSDAAGTAWDVVEYVVTR